MTNRRRNRRRAAVEARRSGLSSRQSQDLQDAAAEPYTPAMALPASHPPVTGHADLNGLICLVFSLDGRSQAGCCKIVESIAANCHHRTAPIEPALTRRALWTAGCATRLFSTMQRATNRALQWTSPHSTPHANEALGTATAALQALALLCGDAESHEGQCLEFVTEALVQRWRPDIQRLVSHCSSCAHARVGDGCADAAAAAVLAVGSMPSTGTPMATKCCSR